VIEAGSSALIGLEVKASATVNTGDFKGLRKLLPLPNQVTATETPGEIHFGVKVAEKKPGQLSLS
jgi:hypothetical protein